MGPGAYNPVFPIISTIFQVCYLGRLIVELLGNRTLKDPIYLLYTKRNYGVDFQILSKLEGSERIAEYRGILIGYYIPPFKIKLVSHAKSMRTGFLFGRQIVTDPKKRDIRFSNLRWPKTVKVKAITLRQKKKTHGKNEKSHDKRKNVMAKRKNLTAERKRLAATKKPYGEKKRFTAKEKISREKVKEGHQVSIPQSRLKFFLNPLIPTVYTGQSRSRSRSLIQFV